MIKKQMKFNKSQLTSFIRKMILLANMNKTCFVSFLSGSGNTNKGADPGDEPQLHRVQIPTDQSTSLDEGMFKCQPAQIVHVNMLLYILLCCVCLT